jgi:hypothetical protein
LYVPTAETRVLKFWVHWDVWRQRHGQRRLGTEQLCNAAPLRASSSTIAVPGGLAVDGNGNLYVAAPADNRPDFFDWHNP